MRLFPRRGGTDARHDRDEDVRLPERTEKWKRAKRDGKNMAFHFINTQESSSMFQWTLFPPLPRSPMFDFRFLAVLHQYLFSASIYRPLAICIGLGVIGANEFPSYEQGKHITNVSNKNIVRVSSMRTVGGGEKQAEKSPKTHESKKQQQETGIGRERKLGQNRTWRLLAANRSRVCHTYSQRSTFSFICSLFWQLKFERNESSSDMSPEVKLRSISLSSSAWRGKPHPAIREIHICGGKGISAIFAFVSIK